MSKELLYATPDAEFLAVLAEEVICASGNVTIEGFDDLDPSDAIDF